MTVRQQQDSSILRGLGVVGFFLLNAAGSWIAYSRFAVNHNMPLPPPVDGERGDLDTPSGRVSYFADRSGVGRPVVLIHSINAAASSYEMKPLFDHYRGERPVYALDLPGFGLSERRDQRYTPQLYNDTIVAFLRDVVGEPADVVVLSLGSEFAAMAALQSPESIHTLTLLSPTGLGRTPAVGEGVYKVVSFPLWGRPLFDLLVIEPSLRFFLGRFSTVMYRKPMLSMRI
jgi:pimeloyl-ACP methyl ester carboxylesterase